MWGIFPDRESSSVCVMLEAPSDPVLLMKAAPGNISLPTEVVEESSQGLIDENDDDRFCAITTEVSGLDNSSQLQRLCNSENNDRA